MKDLEGINKYEGLACNIFPLFYKFKKKIGIFSLCVYRIKNKYSKDISEKYVNINNKKFNIKMLFKRGLKILRYRDYTYFLNIYKISFDMFYLKTCPIQNNIKFTFKCTQHEVDMPVAYNIIYIKKYRGHNAKIHKIPDTENLVCYFRQGRGNSMSITVRENNITDRISKKIMIILAWFMSKFLGSSKKLILYEKECNKYEESASYLYEKLIDMGYKNVYYIIRKNSLHVGFIKPEYMGNIIWAHTFKHYLEFFRCKKFIGTESVMHVLELRVANVFVTSKLQKKKYKYVFLQHGVMYMVSLDSDNRGFFRKGKEMPRDSKIVVSSKLEADHFVELGGFDYDDLYITGLPFYDRTIKKESADKIVIMPTWRPWDYNILCTNYKESSYYNFVLNIYNSVPEDLKNKVWILPHPLVIDIFKNTDLGEFIPDVTSYDKILEDTALLITDYSSISYSAFYRGANVIFVWNEKDECMEHYGGHLMLNEDNVFGSYVYHYEELCDIINMEYLKNQKKEYVERYNKIVEFHDNKNTERLIGMLKKDKFI